MTPCMDVYLKNQSDGSLDKLKSRIVVGVDMQNKELVGDTLSPSASRRILKYFLEDSSKHKERVHKLDFIGNYYRQNLRIGYL